MSRYHVKESEERGPYGCVVGMVPSPYLPEQPTSSDSEGWEDVAEGPLG